MRQDLPERRFRPGLHRFAVLAQHLPQPSPGAKWLDLGGGAGEFSTLVKQLGYDVILVDGDDRNLERVGQLGMSGVKADLNSDLSFLGDAEFDGISLIEVVEHIPLAENLTKEACRVLKPGGVLLLSTPNAVWWRTRLRVMFGHTVEAEGYHYRFFTVDGVRRLCVDAGFAITKMRFSSPAFGYNWLVRKLSDRPKRKHLGIPRPLAGLLAQTIYVVAVKP